MQVLFPAFLKDSRNAFPFLTLSYYQLFGFILKNNCGITWKNNVKYANTFYIDDVLIDMFYIFS